MSAVFIHGLGAVSPAGWGVDALLAAAEKEQPLPVQTLARPGWAKTLTVRSVPPPASRLEFLAHPRLRRAATLSQHTIAAALEAVGADIAPVQAGALRLGVIVCTMAGSVAYSRRFYEEVLREPATASPLLFPETVFNAPASHLAAYLNSPAINATLVGDGGAFLQGLAMAAGWLAEGRADACVVVGAEELDWIIADAVRLFRKSAVYTGGAGALYLKMHPPARTVLSAVTDAFSFTKSQTRTTAARQVRGQLGRGRADELLCDSEADPSAWPDWPGRRLAPKTIVGESFAAAAAWQCVIASGLVQAGRFPGASVRVVGANQQAIGARFMNAEQPAT